MGQMTNLPPENWEKLYQTLIKSNRTFIEVETRKKRYLIWNDVKYYNDPNPPRLNIEDLGRITAAKNEIRKNLKTKSFPDMIGKDFFICVNRPYKYSYQYTESAIFGGNGPEFNQIRENTFLEGKALQIDINSAYLTAVKNMGLLSEKSYKKFFAEETNEAKREEKSKSSRHRGHAGEVYKYSKDCRLIAVGSLAQDRTLYYWENGQIIKQEKDYNEEEANIFFNAAANVGRAMLEVLKECNGFFYWVDAVFIPLSQKEKAFKILEKLGYQYHTKEIYLTQNGGNFETIELETGEHKRYFVPPGKSPKFLELVNDENFINDTLQDYKKALELFPERSEKIRQKTVKYLKQNISLESSLNLRHLAKECLKIGFTVDDILKIQTTIIERHKDAIFDEVMTETIIKRLEKISEPQPMPAPVEDLPNGETIEREFYKDFY